MSGLPAGAVTGLVLTGGGARAAYQVGVLKAIARIRRECGAARGINPFPVIAGTSAGAINAAAIACRADHFDTAVRGLVEVWEHFHVDQVYRSDSIGVIRSGARWLTMMSLGWAIAQWRRAKPRSLLDNAPLHELLQRMIPFDRLGRVMGDGHLEALAVTASSYGTGRHHTFYQSRHPFVPWARTQRVASHVPLGVQHLLASSAIPFVFPATALDNDGRREYFGDGSMGQSAPISPAVHLGAERILVIGAGRMHGPPEHNPAEAGYPSMAQIAGHALSNIFLDALAADIERLQRINHTLSMLTEAQRAKTGLRPIEVLVIAPSGRIDDLAAEHQGRLPAPIRTLLRGFGVSGQGTQARGASLASYLLFEAPYTRELIAMGVADTMARRDDVLRFFGWTMSPARPADQGTSSVNEALASAAPLTSTSMR